MLPLLLLLLALFLIALVLGVYHSHRHPDEAEPAQPAPAHAPADCDGCAAAGTTCYADRMLAHKDFFHVDYFDDEELDAFAHRPADSYTDDETQQFRDVMETMPPTELPDWLHSLQLRSVEFPAALRDELALLLEEGR